jgi:hypothetical protein
MKRLMPWLFAAVCLATSASALRADVIVILKWSVPVFSTRYEVVNDSATPNYARKTISFTETWSYYDIHNVTTGEMITLDYLTWYNIGTTPIKRYSVGDVESSVGFLSRSYFNRAASPNTAPTYNFVVEFNSAVASGGPDDPTTPDNWFSYFQLWDSVIKAAQPITTVIPAKATPPTPAQRVLLPSGATGAHQGFRQELFFPGTPGNFAAVPTNKRYTLEKGTTTLNYDSVLTGKANAPLAANVHVFDFDGVEVFPGTLSYAVKVVRDSLEKLGYEIESELDSNR